MALLTVKDLSVHYPVRQGIWQRSGVVRAVEEVSFSLDAGETLGLVGESGCGKSTLGRALVRLEAPCSGTIHMNSVNLAALKGRELRQQRKNFQMIFQDPYGSLNPRLTIFSALNEVLLLHTTLDRSGREKRICELMQIIGLKPEMLNRYPHQFSGGQRQRIGIARALAAEPKLIVADEPVSALDVSVQAQIINLLQEIQQKTGTAFLFIAHDLGVVEHISKRIMVMYLGRIVEIAPAKELCRSPQHPYTQALLSAVPSLDVTNRKKRVILSGDVPSPLNPPSGCAFHPRCLRAQAICRQQVPELRQINGSQCRCFFPGAM